MPFIYGPNNEPIWIEEEDYPSYVNHFTDVNNAPPSMYATGAGGENTGLGQWEAEQASRAPTQQPRSGNLRDYLGGRDPSLYGQAAQYGAQTGVALAAGPAAPAAGLWFTIGDYIMKGVHGDSWTPDKYQPLTEAGRQHYFDEHQTPETRAQNLGPLNQERNTINPRMVRYLYQVQPYEDMVFYNARTPEGKMRAYGYSQWAGGRLRDRMPRDLDAMEARELADKYKLTLPDYYKNWGPFRVDPNSFSYR